jgi:hypothetical protein
MMKAFAAGLRSNTALQITVYVVVGLVSLVALAVSGAMALGLVRVGQYSPATRALGGVLLVALSCGLLYGVIQLGVWFWEALVWPFALDVFGPALLESPGWFQTSIKLVLIGGTAGAVIVAVVGFLWGLVTSIADLAS